MSHFCIFYALQMNSDSKRAVEKLRFVVRNTIAQAPRICSDRGLQTQLPNALYHYILFLRCCSHSTRSFTVLVTETVPSKHRHARKLIPPKHQFLQRHAAIHARLEVALFLRRCNRGARNGEEKSSEWWPARPPRAAVTSLEDMESLEILWR